MDNFQLFQEPGVACVTLEHQLNADLARANVPSRLSSQQEREYVERARAGDSAARESLLLDLVGFAKNIANRYGKVFAWAAPRVEFLDLVQTGMLKACEYFPLALASPNPCAYLRMVVRGYILQYCQHYASLIKSGKDTQGRPLPLLPVESLDVAVDWETGETLYDLLPEPERTSPAARDYTPLYEAVKQLPPRQAETIIRHYGLEGEAETLKAIGQSFQRPGTTTTSANGTTYKKMALRKLYQRLEGEYLST